MHLSADPTEHRGSALRMVPPSRRRDTALARRRRHIRLLREFATDLGIERPTAAERVLLEQAATITLRAEQLRDAIERGETIEGDEIVRLSGHLRRLFAGLQRTKPRDDGESLSEYLATAYGTSVAASGEKPRDKARKGRSRTRAAPTGEAGTS